MKALHIKVLLTLSFITCLVYFNGLNGPFILDDHYTFSKLTAVDSDQISISEYVRGESKTVETRPLARASFLLFSGHYPEKPIYFKSINLSLHLLCGILIFYITNVLLQLHRREHESSFPFVAVMTTAIWLLHPFNVSTVLYSVQRMTILSALFALAGFLYYLNVLRSRSYQLTNALVIRPAAVISLFLIAGVLSKENALLLLPSILLTHYLFGKEFTPAANRIIFGLLAFGTIILVTLLILYSLNSPLFEVKGFTILERILTQSRILVIYISQLVLPRYAEMSLFNDDIINSSSLVSPVTTLLSTLLISGLIGLCFSRIDRLYKWSIAWFFIWHIMESTILPLDMYYEHRNYVSAIGPIFGLSYLVVKLLQEKASKPMSVIAGVTTLALLGLSYQTYKLTDLWSDEERMLLSWQDNNPTSVLTFLEIHKLHLKREDNEAAYYLLKSVENLPIIQDNIEFWLYHYNASCANNKPTKLSKLKLMTLTTEPFSTKLINIGGYQTVIMNILNGNCRPERIQDIQLILSNITSNSKVTKLRKIKATMIMQQSYIAQHYGQLDYAYKLLNQSFRTRPSPEALARLLSLSSARADANEQAKWLKVLQRKTHWHNSPLLQEWLN